mmetsp:Transcript_12817/g.31146  ORF Transcript_12817/g.31146 Transcript_12817/m.31146 type:complete len:248 (-) Transcript_12817:612-1355(-)
MAPNTRSAAQHTAPNSWSAAQHVLALVEIWALVAEPSGFVGARRLMRVCRASLEGVKEYLGTLPGLVICGGDDDSGLQSDVWRLDLATLQWGSLPSLVVARDRHAWCTVRGALVVLGGCINDKEEGIISSVEMLSAWDAGGDGAFTNLPPLSCGGVGGAVAVAVDESTSAAGQVLLLGVLGGEGATDEDDFDEDEFGVPIMATVQLVDLATGACTPQPAFLTNYRLDIRFTAVRMPDGRVVCAGGGA